MDNNETNILCATTNREVENEKKETWQRFYRFRKGI